MKKYILAFLSVVFPALSFAAESPLGFKPPPSDSSVVFLGNIFGVVDGVLHGSGSQIMGSMFTVFNAAVLALGGIIIMYTLLVSTMNTAQEGQFLGQKWSSLWVPIRTTFGLALLIPKASGYCLMQIFVMWIVVQGVGAADRVWDAALSYLNRGGAIIQQQSDPSEELTSTSFGELSQGVQVILAGQVCMLGLQKQLEEQRSSFLRLKQDQTGPCYGDVAQDMQGICNTAVPNFLNSVNIISAYNKSKKAAKYHVSMPNFPSNSPYSRLNGICGTIHWNAFKFKEGTEKNIKKIDTITENDIDTAKMSRAIGIQQIYLNMALVAQVMINNNPSLSTRRSDEMRKNEFSSVANNQFGVPKTMDGDTCTNALTPDCIMWGPTSGGGALFNGTEFKGAISDYNSIMRPTLNLIAQSDNIKAASASRKFINEANSRGWIMAGSYFFNLVNLNYAAQQSATMTDSKIGLNHSSFDASQLSAAFKESAPGEYQCVGRNAILCQWLDSNPKKIQPVVGLIQGGYDNVSSVSTPNLTTGAQRRRVITGLESSTVYGYTTNASIVQLPGQPGAKPLKFANVMNITMPKPHPLPQTEFPCGELKIAFFKICLGKLLGTVFYNFIIVNIYNAFGAIVQPIMDQIIYGFLLLPLQALSSIFKGGIEIIAQPDVNPIVALANMGTYYINFAAELWQRLIEASVAAALIPIFGLVFFGFLALSLPVILAWLSTMVMIGFFTAFYIPVLPYMIFTFGSIAWLIAVIEAMVAAPIVALGVTHPEGHEAFGKGEQAVMLLMNVFLRPSLMIIGYISGIALSYVGVWILTAGFDNAIGFMQGSEDFATGGSGKGGNRPSHTMSVDSSGKFTLTPVDPLTTEAGVIQGGYTGWSGVFAYFFSILIYTMMYLIIVQRSFTLISYLPDKVLRWIGEPAEGIGQEAAQWGEEAKSKLGEAGKDTQSARAAGDKAVAGYATKGIGKAKSALGGSSGGNVKASGGKGGGEGGGGGGGGGGGDAPGVGGGGE